MKAEEFRLSEYADTISAVLESGGEFRIYPKGTSMLPLLRAGTDSVVLEKPTGNLKRGDIAFYIRDNGAYVLHRVIKSEGDSYTLCGDNQLTLEKGITNRNIIGVVTRIYRGEKLKLSYIPYYMAELFSAKSMLKAKKNVRKRKLTYVCKIR